MMKGTIFGIFSSQIYISQDYQSKQKNFTHAWKEYLHNFDCFGSYPTRKERRNFREQQVPDRTNAAVDGVPFHRIG